MRFSQTVLIAVPLLVGLAAQGVGADPIRFSVVGGRFGSSGSSSTSYRSGNGTAQISFARASSLFSFDLDDGETQSIASYGRFSVSGTGRSTISIDDTFTLTLLVYQPAFGLGSRTAELEGRLKQGDSGMDLMITFPTGTLNIPEFSLPALSFAFGSVTLSEAAGENQRHLTGSATYRAAASSPPPSSAAAPLPATVWMGIVLLGGLALKRVLARRAVAAA